jgi:hypothetical protein
MLTKKLLAIIVPAVLLTACGGGDNGGLSSSFSLAVSDAPVDDLSEVVICFNQVELKGNGSDLVFTVGEEQGTIAANDKCLDDNDNVIPNTVGLDLLKYAGSDSISLVENVSIPAGSYSQLRLIMSDGSYGIDAINGDKIDVSVPSNELKLDGFNASLGGAVDFTLEFDLRHAMTNPVGQTGYFLKPRGVRLVDNSQANHITGSVTAALLSDIQCNLSPGVNGDAVATVYLYQGSDLARELLGDNYSPVDGSDSNNGEISPYASTSVTLDDEQNYHYEIGFVTAGDYTIALSCDIDDDPETDDNISFIEAQNVSVTADNMAINIVFSE